MHEGGASSLPPEAFAQAGWSISLRAFFVSMFFEARAERFVERVFRREKIVCLGG